MIKKFQKTTGRYIEKIYGQERLAYAVYSGAIYAKGFYYFLQGDYGEKRITLFKYLPETILEIVVSLSINDIDLYNLHLVGNPIHIVSQDDTIRCYYPEVFSFSCEHNETLEFIENGKVYLSAWVEEGWDDEANRATENYQYYDKVLVKDFSGKILSEDIGSLHQAPDGSWWIS